MENIEFFVGADGNVWLRKGNECRMFSTKDNDIIELVRDKIIRMFPKAYERLRETFQNLDFNKWIMNFNIVNRFIRCNMGSDNLQKFDVEEGFLNLEEVSCPLRGICPDENVICRPDCKTVFSKAEKEVVKLYVQGYTIDEIADKLHKCRNTVNTQIWTVTRRLGLDNRRKLVKLAVDNKLF